MSRAHGHRARLDIAGGSFPGMDDLFPRIVRPAVRRILWACLAVIAAALAAVTAVVAAWTLS